ncbi:MAG: 4Fe-4S dicluster domain-containing protein [Chitinivibrionales bacterium]|nr:4Fe-4S dicluster domain-containing protein [Chitinivibrionales bacterium]
MKQMSVISGKGGTGKTSVLASFAALAERPVVADCDVDAADLHLVLSPTVEHRETFFGGRKATVRQGACSGCGMCKRLCRYEAVGLRPFSASDVRAIAEIDDVACEGCGVCAWFCPVKAIDFDLNPTGSWYVSTTRYGPMVHARLNAAEENSGKLVSQVREVARKRAEMDGRELVLVDGPPGIGCPVIASVTGCDLVLIVTEPTVSGIHDMARVAQLAAGFGIQALVCVNKWDINPDMTARIEEQAGSLGIGLAGRVPYDRAITDAQIAGKPVVEFTDGPVRDTIVSTWEKVCRTLGL